MTDRQRHHQHGTWRMGLLAGTATLALGFAGPAMAQQQGGQQGQGGAQAQQQGQGGQQARPGQAPSQQAGSAQPAVVGQLRTAEQALRNAQTQVTGGQQPQPNMGMARTAVDGGLTALGRVPQEAKGQDAYRAAERELNEAKQALQAQQPDTQRAAAQLREAADALGMLAGRIGGSADASGGNGQASTATAQRQGAEGGQAGSQITVQQRQPQVTVLQQPPQVVVNQPPPQVNVQQPEPRVTVQQAQPQVTVRHAEPRVQVQQQGQPQITVRREGEPQVTIGSQPDARSGANSASTPQSGGPSAQTAAASPAGGMDLRSVQDLVGKNVVGSSGRDAGEVRNLLIDGQGRVRAAVVEWGGFLGIGERQAMVPIERIKLNPGGGDRAELTMTRAELEALPSYDRDRIAEEGRNRGWGDGLRLFR